MDEDQIRKIVESELTNSYVKKIGDTPTDALQLTPKKYVDASIAVVNSSIVGIQSSIAGLGVTNLFGDGSDGDVALTVSSVLSRDMYYNSLSVSNNSTLNPNGYKIFVKTTTTINSGSAIARVGNNASGTSPGSSLSAGTLPGALGGKTGGSGGGGWASGTGGANGRDATDGTAGDNTNPSIGTSGVSNASQHGGDGGVANALSGGVRGTGAAGGVATPALNLPDSPIACYINADLTSTYTQHQGSASTGGSGGGGGGGHVGSATSASGSGGQGGANGGNGGVIALYSKTIINNATGGISVKGGNGGNGANGTNATGDGVTQQGGGGGGGGGCGGTGGVIILVYNTLTQNGTFDISGGTYGNGGTAGTAIGGGSAGSDGQLGLTGGSGKLWSYQI